MLFPNFQKDEPFSMFKSVDLMHFTISLSHYLVGAHLDLSAFSSPEELMSLGLDRLKTALQALKTKMWRNT